MDKEDHRSLMPGTLANLMLVAQTSLMLVAQASLVALASSEILAATVESVKKRGDVSPILQRKNRNMKI